MALHARSRKSSVASEWYSTRNDSDLEGSDVEIREELSRCGLTLTRSASTLPAKDGADEMAMGLVQRLPDQADGYSIDTSNLSEVELESWRIGRSASGAQGQQETESLLLDAFQERQPAPGEGMSRSRIKKAMSRCSAVAEFFSMPEVLWQEGGCLDAVDQFLQDRIDMDGKARLDSLWRLAALSNSIKARSTHSDECLETAAAIGTAITSLELVDAGIGLAAQPENTALLQIIARDGEDDASHVSSWDAILPRPTEDDEAKCDKLTKAFEEFDLTGRIVLDRKSVAMAVKQCVVVAQFFGFLAANKEVDKSLHMQLATSKDVPTGEVSFQEFVALVRYARGHWHKAAGLQRKRGRAHEQLRACSTANDTNICVGRSERIFVGSTAGNDFHPDQETDLIAPRASQGENVHSGHQHVPQEQQQQQQQQQQPAGVEGDHSEKEEEVHDIELEVRLVSGQALCQALWCSRAENVLAIKQAISRQTGERQPFRLLHAGQPLEDGMPLSCLPSRVVLHLVRMPLKARIGNGEAEVRVSARSRCSPPCVQAGGDQMQDQEPDSMWPLTQSSRSYSISGTPASSQRFMPTQGQLQERLAPVTPDAPMSAWSVDDVSNWAAQTQALPPEVAWVMREHAVNGLVLSSITEEDLYAMGIRKFGWRRHLVLLVQCLKEKPGHGLLDCAEVADAPRFVHPASLPSTNWKQSSTAFSVMSRRDAIQAAVKKGCHSTLPGFSIRGLASPQSNHRCQPQLQVQKEKCQGQPQQQHQVF
eukprot:TRINITY_DN8566_c0_g1_i1.p1 TRINITY_DN8566_c0_g1~~TRINITY_DN8566_c0_g1_i1.p1  ORF type:complete len:763 (-),score=139.69 TRINITY_DN8566_c0_g1_i1:151-2439(-)